MFDWKEFIDFANELFFKYDTIYKEANYRTIISRCYYGIFKQVEDYLKSLKISLPEEDKKGRKLGSHEKKVYFLQSHRNSEVRSFGDKLAELKYLRHRADYVVERIKILHAQKAVYKANNLFKEWDIIKSLI